MWATDTAAAAVVTATGQESSCSPLPQLRLGHLQDLRWQCWLLTSSCSSLPSPLQFCLSSWCTNLCTLFPYHLSTTYLLILVAPSPPPSHAWGYRGALQCLSDLACTTWMQAGASHVPLPPQVSSSLSAAALGRPPKEFISGS